MPELLATPTHVDGNLDPAVPVKRLRGPEEPWPLDFEQALLRLPRDTGSEVVADLTSAAGLTSPAGPASAAGRRLVEWVAEGGLPDPVSTRFDQLAGRSEHRDSSEGSTSAGRANRGWRAGRPGWFTWVAG